MKKVSNKILAIVLILSLFTIFETSVALFASELYNGSFDFSQLNNTPLQSYDPYYDPYIIGSTILNNQQTNLLFDNKVEKFIISTKDCAFNVQYDFELDCPVQNSTPVLVPARGVHRTTDEIKWCKINTSNGDIWIPRFMAIPSENFQYYPYYFNETEGCYILVKRPNGAILACEDVNYVYFNLYKRSFYYSEFFSIPTFNPQ